MAPAFPKQLKYMQPFLRTLARLPPEDLNEDIDPTVLEKALRKRLSKGDAETILNDDRQALEKWLASFDSNEHPAHWILGYISCLSPEDLDNLPPPEPRGPTVHIDVPAGWTPQIGPGTSMLRKGELFAAISVIDAFSYGVLKQQFAHWPALPFPVESSRQQSPVQFGSAAGVKYVYLQSKPSPWKQVDYLLEVEGGYVSIRVCAMGADFEEREVEDMLGTLRVVPAVS